MADSNNESQFNTDEFDRIFNEYRAKIAQITHQTELDIQSLQSPVEPVQANTAAPEEPEAEEATEQAAEPPEDTATPSAETPEVEEEEEVVPVTESAKTIRDAKKKAKQIIAEAEAQVKKEARKKTQAQVDKLLAKAQKEAEDIIARARATADQERELALQQAVQQVQQQMQDMIEQCRLETRMQSEKMLRAAMTSTDDLLKEIVKSSGDINRRVKDVMGRARSTIDEFEAQFQSETTGLTEAITETQDRIAQLVQAAEETLVRAPAPRKEANGQNGRKTDTPILSVHILGERSNGRNGTQPLFFGKVELTSDDASFDYRYLKNMKKHFNRLPAIKYIQETASEKDVSVLLDISEPLPLLDVLSTSPNVDEVVSKSDREYTVVFKPL